MQLKEEIQAFRPYNAQEAEDQRVILAFLEQYPDTLFSRTSSAHFTVSAWIVNAERTKVLMIFHNIYRSWSWTGGHVAHEGELRSFALRKARQETGLQAVRPALDGIYSIEVIAANGYELPEGGYCSSHLHLNLTYLLEADETEEIRTDERETCGAKWFDLRRAAMLSNGSWIRSVYEKLNAKLDTI